jgi:hypothetical protein
MPLASRPAALVVSSVRRSIVEVLKSVEPGDRVRPMVG